LLVIDQSIRWLCTLLAVGSVASILAFSPRSSSSTLASIPTVGNDVDSGHVLLGSIAVALVRFECDISNGTRDIVSGVGLKLHFVQAVIHVVILQRNRNLNVLQVLSVLSIFAVSPIATVLAV
jgi:hypothetical protein